MHGCDNAWRMVAGRSLHGLFHPAGYTVELRSQQGQGQIECSQSDTAASWRPFDPRMPWWFFQCPSLFRLVVLASKRQPRIKDSEAMIDQRFKQLLQPMWMRCHIFLDQRQKLPKPELQENMSIRASATTELEALWVILLDHRENIQPGGNGDSY